MHTLLDQLPTPAPELLSQLSKRLRKHIGHPEKKLKVHLSTRAGVSVSISTALKAQIQEYLTLHKLSASGVLRAAVIEFITTKRPYQCPVKFTPTTKFAPRNTLVGFAVHTGVHEELEVFAADRHLTMAAVVRRAVYEYTKPETPNTPDPVAAIDAWADREI